MKLANIVYEKDLVNHTPLSYVNYYKEPLEYDKINNGLPTLYVGWYFLKRCNPANDIIKNASVLDTVIISNELYWVSSFDESKSSHVKGVEEFIKAIPDYYFSPKYHYINLDPVFFQIKDIDDLFDVLPKSIDRYFNLKDEMIYLLKDNQIWGISLNMYRFFKFNIDEIKSRISDRTSVEIDDLSGEIYESHYKILPEFTNLKRYLVTL